MIRITGSDLEPEGLARIAREREEVELDPGARGRIRSARALVEDLVRSDAPVYGVNTGFGRLAEVRVSPDEQRELQRNLVRSHAAGWGAPLPVDEVRAIVALRANALARGHSGCRPVVVERLLDLLNRGIHPVVPSVGSVGASGDLGPLAHVALALTGEGEVETEGGRLPAGEALAGAGLEPVELLEKEGLALINGTQATTGIGTLVLLRAEALADTADLAAAATLEGLRGTPEPFRPQVHEARPHGGQIASARRLRALLADSEIRESHRYDDPRVQDAYSLRCAPQVHGAAREALGYVRGVLTREANASTDNPLVFPEERLVVSAGNFHAQIVAQALDLLCIAVADLAAIAERRIERLLNPDLSGHPAFLTPEPGLRSGFMIVQVTAADLLGEMRVLAHPASVDSVSTSASQEDHVSMGMAAARKARRAVECLEGVLAAELLCASQALDFLEPLRPGRGVARAHHAIRERVAPLEEDRPPAPDLEAVATWIREGEGARVVQAVLEEEMDEGGGVSEPEGGGRIGPNGPAGNDGVDRSEREGGDG